MNRKWSDAIRFHPWVGENYSNPKLPLLGEASARLLVLGESHYGNEINEFWGPESTVQIVEGNVFEGPHKYFTNMALSLIPSGTATAGRDSIKEVFRNIAFYNYVPHLMPNRGTRPTKQQFHDGATAFVEVLGTLKPTHVWVAEKELWRMMTNDGFSECPALTTEKMTLENGIYDLSGVQLVAFATYHPSSSRYAADLWRPLISRAIKEISAR